MKRFLFGLVFTFAFVLCACSGPSPELHHHAIQNQFQLNGDPDGDVNTPIKLVGERLFRETRFSQYFSVTNWNALTLMPQKGDDVVENLVTISGSIANPYRGQAMACAACHFVEQANDIQGGGSRAYTDFARRSPIPNRNDGHHETARNSPNMVGSAVNNQFFLHHDGEFANPEDLVRASLTGRNMGWLPDEQQKAIEHIVRVVRGDDGTFPTETDLKGLAYKDLLVGAANIPGQFLIPIEYRFDIKKMSDEEVFNGVVKVIGGYLRSLDFRRDSNGNYKGSPFDLFLHKNGMPLSPDVKETAEAYSQRLAQLLANSGSQIQFVQKNEKTFKLHKQDFVFGPLELQGYQIFAGRGRCVACHAAPDFTDHLFHNTGASQKEYDLVHGPGKFAQLVVPNLQERNAHFEHYLPATGTHTLASGQFRASPRADQPAFADLGVWNIFGNPDVPAPQTRMRQAICDSLKLDCGLVSDAQLLDYSLGMIKTPTLRDLGQSQPYMHTGQFDRIEDVIQFYIQQQPAVRMKRVRNVDPQIKDIRITSDDVAALSAFLRSLNEDYD